MSFMHPGLLRIDGLLARCSYLQIIGFAACDALIIGFIDHLTGYEVSVSLLYLAPVLLAAWYAGPGAGAIISLLCCLSWFVADVAAGQAIGHPVIETWNSLVRLAYFIAIALFASALRKSLSNERRLARTDALTGVCSRRAFGELLEHDIALMRRAPNPLTIAMVDLDDFKSLNDTYGHAEGDRALRTMGRVLQERIRRRGDTVARLGGDEFALILPNTDQAGAASIITEFRRDLQEAFETSRWKVSCSIGVVTFCVAPTSVDEALNSADTLMYAAKRQAKGSVSFKVIV